MARCMQAASSSRHFGVFNPRWFARTYPASSRHFWSYWRTHSMLRWT